MSTEVSMTRFFSLHPELASACWTTAREATNFTNPQKMYKDLMVATWDEFDSLTRLMYAGAPPGKTIEKVGLLLHPNIQQAALQGAIKKTCGEGVKVPRISQLPLSAVFGGNSATPPNGPKVTSGGDSVPEEKVPAGLVGTGAATPTWLSHPVVLSVLRSLSSLPNAVQGDIRNCHFQSSPVAMGGLPPQSSAGNGCSGGQNAQGQYVVGLGVGSIGLEKSGAVQVASCTTHPWRAAQNQGASYGPVNPVPPAQGVGPYLAGSANVGSGVDGQQPQVSGACHLKTGISSDNVEKWPEGGGVKRWLKPRADGSAANFPDIIKWAKNAPSDSPFIRDEPKQVSYRRSPGQCPKGVGKGKAGKSDPQGAYCMIIKPLRGKGNVTVYRKNGLVQINCGDQALPWFLGMVESWTTL